MKATVIRYGLYGAAAICFLFLLAWTAGSGLDYGTQEIIGYAAMVISLSLVFFGIKHYRDKENNGIVSFGRALVIGILISIITALAFGILDVMYIKYINPEFMSEYYEVMANQIRETAPAEEVQSRLELLDSQQEMFGNPLVTFVVMFLTVLVIGFIISLISSLILQRKNK